MPSSTTMKQYTGSRSRNGDLSVTVNGAPLPPRNDLYNHSPDGFECGYSGSGPAQLALAMCCDFLGSDDRAMRCYQTVKAHLIAHLPRNAGWTITELELAAAILEAESGN